MQRSGIDTIKTTPDQESQLESDNFTIRHHKREPKGHPYPSWGPQGINEQTRTKALQKQDRKMSFKCDRGPIFQVTNLNRNLTQLSHLEIHCQPDLTERNCILRHVTTKYMR